MASEFMEPKEEFYYFAGKESPLHPLHKAEFQVDGVKYNFIEQYVLHKKAEMCLVKQPIADLMKVSDPNHLKKFEKTFVVADTETWETKQKEFTKKGYMEKSRQVKALLDLLKDTKGKVLVYATQRDCHLGIGVETTDPLSRRRSNWKGKNLLGEWLMEVREEIQNLPEDSSDDVASIQEATGGGQQHTEVGKESCGPEKFTFFWKMESPFSQWHPCSFVIDDQWYNCAEQYMMHQKAAKFGDSSAMWGIMNTDDPKKQKAFGRKVANLNANEWHMVSKDVVKRGNLAKFGQNERLKQLLFATAGTTLVEASPLDQIWGIGLHESDPKAQNRKTWQGENRLGQILTEVREELMSQDNARVQSQHGEGPRGAREKVEAGKPTKRKADDINQGQERKSTEGVTDAKLSKADDRNQGQERKRTEGVTDAKLSKADDRNQGQESKRTEGVTDAKLSKADDRNQGQERKRTDGVTDTKLSKGPAASGKERDQQKGHFQSGNGKREQTQRQDSSPKEGRIINYGNYGVAVAHTFENWDGEMVSAESNIEPNQKQHDSLNGKTKSSMETNSVSHSQDEAPVEKIKLSSEEAEEEVDPAWEGFNTMELDLEEDAKEKKRRERSNDTSHEINDKVWPLKKGRTGYSSRQEQEKPEDSTRFDDQEGPTEKFTFFWRADSPFSQHHPANFTVRGIGYNCAEQYMMHQKAEVFNDVTTGYEIMNTTNPAKQKSLAKQVRGFDEVHWKTLRRDVVKRGNIEKFSQNPRLRRMLFATAGTTMVEASPVDNTWGIGLHADDPKAWNRRTWAGGNLLGEILTEVREELMEKFKFFPEEEEDRMSYRKSDGYGEQYTVFWRPVSPFHPRYPVGFVLDDQIYWTLQQYILHQKALFFNDMQTARTIMENFRPNKLEELGRKVRNYDNRVWSRYCRSYLLRGNFAKFSQNPHIRQQLFDNVLNGDLVFAVEEDLLLGVGLKDDDGRLYRKASWRGKNLLGQALMKVREMLIRNEQTLPEIVEVPDDEATGEELPQLQFQFFFNESPFNQWKHCRFSVGNFQYSSAEQYMVHRMALHFGDAEAAEFVMRCGHPRDLQTVAIRNYDWHDWGRVCKEIIMEGNRAKFTQDNKLREELLNTGDVTLAYSCVKDSLLGTGLRDTDPRSYDPQNWPGDNLLGEVLTELREELKQKRNDNKNSNNNNSGVLSRKAWHSESKESVEDSKSGQPAEKFTFFWTKSPFSQWWKCEIKVDGCVYNCAEQYMMHKKALYFNDLETAKKIMKNPYPLNQWKLGREVRGYDSVKWNAVCRDIVKTGNMEKFSQHPRTRQQLFDTVGTTLVEASPADSKWGIGVKENDPRAWRRETWLGENLLGQILTEVRDELMKRVNDSSQKHSASVIRGDSIPTRRDRRGSDRSDSSQGHRKYSESRSSGFSHKESYQRSWSDHCGPTGNQSHGGRRSDHTGAEERPSQHSGGGRQWSRQNSRPSHAEQQPRVDESRHFRDGNRQRPLANTFYDERRNKEKQHQVHELKSTSSGRSEQRVSQKSSSTPSRQSEKTVTQDFNSVPTQHSVRPVTQSATTQSLQSESRDSNTSSTVVVDETISSENIHVISETDTLSVWHEKNFKVDGFQYKSVGQYIAHQKALRFNDGISAEEIMKSNRVRIMKSEKYIDGFDEKKWNSVYRNVVKDGNYYKFSQNEDLQQDLLATSGRILVYADSKDCKLGVGLKPDETGINDRNHWKGENILGLVLMEVREDLITGRDSSKTSRGQDSDAVVNYDVLKEMNQEDKEADVQKQILDRDVKQTTSEDNVSLDTGTLEATGSSYPEDKGEPEKDAEATALEQSTAYKKDNASETQRPDIFQEVTVRTAISEETIPKPLVSTDNRPDPKVANKVVKSLDALEIQQKVEAAESNSEQAASMTEKEMKFTKVINETVAETVATQKSSSLADDAEIKKTAASCTPPSLENDERFIKVPPSEITLPVAQSGCHFETKLAAESVLVERKIDAKDSVSAEVHEAEFDSKSQAASNDKDASNLLATIDTQATSQIHADDHKRNDDGNEITMMPKPQVLDAENFFESQTGEKTAVPDAGKWDMTSEFSKYSADGGSHQEETVFTAPEMKGLKVQTTTASACQVTLAKEEMDKRSNTEEMSHSAEEKEHLAEKTGIESHQGEAVSAASKAEALQVQDSNEESVQQASTTVTEGPDDKTSTESHSETDVSAAFTEIMSHDTTSVKEELDDKSRDGNNQETASAAAEKEILETEAENACQETSGNPGDASSVEASKAEDVSNGDRELLAAEYNSEITIQRAASVELELGDKSSLECDQEHVSTAAERSVLQAQIISENTITRLHTSVEGETTDKSGIKLIEQSITEGPDDKSSNECKQEENPVTLHETKSGKDGLGDQSHVGGDQEQAVSTAEVKEILEDPSSIENSYKEMKLRETALDDETENTLEDKSSTESISKVSSEVKETLEFQTSSESANQETTSVAEEVGSEAKEASEDKSSTENHQAETDSVVAEKEVLPTPADTEITNPLISTKAETDKNKTINADVGKQVTDVSQQATAVCGRNDNPPKLTNLQIVGERNAESEEH